MRETAKNFYEWLIVNGYATREDLDVDIDDMTEDFKKASEVAPRLIQLLKTISDHQEKRKYEDINLIGVTSPREDFPVDWERYVTLGNKQPSLLRKEMKDDRIVVETAAGTIVAEKNGDPGAPGIGMYFIPKGHDVEIDLALVEVKENLEYRTNGETCEDVALYIYGNYSRDEYTERIDYPREGILAALEYDDADLV